jgi:hypothetical protein
MEVTVFIWTTFASAVTLFLVLASASVYFSGTSVDQQIVWDPLSQTLPVAEFKLPLVTVSNIRNFSYPTYDEHHAKPHYYNRTYNVDEIKQVYYALGVYPEISSGAHVWLTFEFENGDAVSISVEARAREGEEMSLFYGLFNKYHLIYQVVDERDIITLRAVLRDNNVYLLPAAKDVSKELFRQVFVEMLERANELRNKTEWYNTIFNSCIMNVVRHVNKIRPDSIPNPFSMDVLLSGNSGKLFYNLGLLDTTKSYKDLFREHKVNCRAIKYQNDAEFSKKIRQWGTI